MKYLILLLPIFLFGQWNNTAFIKGTQNETFSQDAATNTLITTSYPHHEVHSGSHYFIAGYTTLGSGDSTYFALTTPNTTKWTHMIFEIQSSGILTSYVYETATVTGGTAVVPNNNNRNSTNTSGNTVVSMPSISVYGTCIDSSKVGAGGGFKFGGNISRDNENILKQNTTYLYVFVSGAASNIVAFKAEWYEHTNK